MNKRPFVDSGFIELSDWDWVVSNSRECSFMHPYY